MRPLVYLAIRRLVNSIKRLPKNPRLLIPVIFFALILASQVFPLVLLHQLKNSPSRHHAHHPAVVVAPTHKIGLDSNMLVASIKGLLIVSLLTAVVSALGDGNLFFEPSDIDFLFPAPLKRRSVLLFRMVPRYAMLILVAAYFPLIFGALLLESTPDLNLLALWPGVLGTYLFLVTGTNIAQAGIIFRWQRDSGGSTPEQRRRVTTLSMCLAGLVIVAGYLVTHQAIGGGSPLKLSDALAFLNSRATSLALAPISWAADLFRVAYDGWDSGATARLAGLFVLAGLSFVVLFLRERDFYEGATEVSARRVRVVAAARRGDSGALLSQMAEDGMVRKGVARNLRSFGGGAWAILWCDVITIIRMPLRNWIPLLVIALFPAFFGHVIRQRTDVEVLAWMCMFCIQMSSIFLIGVRMMVRRADITKALPIGPVRFLLAEQAMSIAQLTLLGWLSLSLMVLFGGGKGPYLVVAYLVFPTLTTLIIFVQTSFVLLYPQQNDAAQNIIGNILGLFVSILALLPCVFVGVTMTIFHVAPFLIGLAAAAVNVCAATGAVLLAAYLWQRFDPTG